MNLQEKILLGISILGAAILCFAIMAWTTSRPVCAGKLVQFSQANVEGDMEPFGFVTKFGDIGMSPSMPGQYCIEVRKIK